MIEASIFRNCDGSVKGFSVLNHGETNVCAAVSMLVINTVNSIETFTDAEFSCRYNEEGGHLTFDLSLCPDGRAALLLDAMVLGLKCTLNEYPGEIKLVDSSNRQDKSVTK